MAVTDNEPEPFLWINPKDMLKIGRKLGPHLAGCHFELANMSAKNNGVMIESDAILILADAPKMNMD